MMEYFINLKGHFTKPSKNKYLGIALALISLAYFTVGYFDNGFKTSSLIFTLIMLINAAISYARSKGILLFTKTYFKIDDNILAVKITSRKSANWENIRKIIITDDAIELNPWDKNFQQINLGILDESIKGEIIEQLKRFAFKKDIEVEAKSPKFDSKIQKNH